MRTSRQILDEEKDGAVSLCPAQVSLWFSDIMHTQALNALCSQIGHCKLLEAI